MSRAKPKKLSFAKAPGIGTAVSSCADEVSKHRQHNGNVHSGHSRFAAWSWTHSTSSGQQMMSWNQESRHKLVYAPDHVAYKDYLRKAPMHSTELSTTLCAIQHRFPRTVRRKRIRISIAWSQSPTSYKEVPNRRVLQSTIGLLSAASGSPLTAP